MTCAAETQHSGKKDVSYWNLDNGIWISNTERKKVWPRKKKPTYHKMETRGRSSGCPRKDNQQPKHIKNEINTPTLSLFSLHSQTPPITWVCGLCIFHKQESLFRRICLVFCLNKWRDPRASACCIQRRMVIGTVLALQCCIRGWSIYCTFFW